MTVRELINALEEFPTGIEVLVEGYEGGVEPPARISMIRIRRNVNDATGFFGVHEEVRHEGMPWDAQAVLIERS